MSGRLTMAWFRRGMGSIRIILLVGLLMGALVLGACTTTPESGTEGTEGGEEGGGAEPQQIVVALQAEPTALDPTQISDYNSSRATMGMYDTLVHFKDGSTDVEPWLAKSWDISEDGLTYTLELREDVKFHDGTPFNADAVLFNINRQTDPNHPYYDTGTYPYAEFTFGMVESLTKIDDYTVEFKLVEKYAPFLKHLAMHTGGMVSPEAVKERGEDIAINPVGTGPFMFDYWKSGVEVVLKKNPDYWNADRIPSIDRVIYRPIKEDQTRITELMSGKVDFLVNPPPDDLPRLKDEFKIQELPGMHIWYLVMNCQKEPFDDQRVRQAANYAINRKAIVDNILKGTGTLADGYLPPVVWSYNEDVHMYDYNPDKAKELLADAGYGDGVDVVFWVPETGSGMQQPTVMATAIQEDLAAVGINAEIQTFEWGTYLDMVFTEDHDSVAELHEMSWIGDNGDPDNFLYILLSGEQWPPNGFNEAFFADEEIDELLIEAQKSTDESEREQLYKEVQALLMEAAPWVPIDHQTQIAIMDPAIQDFTLHPTGVFRFETVTLKDE